jgi:hypothetical protein
MRVEERLSHRRILRTVRPPRAVVAIPGGGDWEVGALHALQVLSTTWGGAGFLVLPISSTGSHHKAFDEILQVYDADVWGFHALTNRGWRDSSPAQYSTWLEASIQNNISGGMTEEQVREHFESDHSLDRWWEPFQLPESTTESIGRRTSPVLDYSGEIRPDVLIFDSAPQGGAFVDAVDLDPLPEQIALVDGAWMSPRLRLLLAARLGSLSPQRRHALESRGVDVTDVTATRGDLRQLLDVAWFRNRDESFLQIQKAYAEASGKEVPYSAVNNLNLEKLAPFAVSRVGCHEWGRWFPGFDDLPIVVVAGDSADDFAYAMALDRMNSPAVWLPRSELQSPRFASVALPLLARGLKSLAHRAQDRTILLTSLTQSRSQLLRLRRRMRSASLFADFEIEVRDKAEIPSLWPAFLADPAIVGEPLDEPFDGDTASRGLGPRRPTAVTSARTPSHLRWWVEAEMPTHLMPTRTKLNSIVVCNDQGWGPRGRVSRRGVAYASHADAFVLSGMLEDHQLARPTIRQPSADVIFSALLAGEGYEIRESDAGGFHRQCAELWGGHERLEDDLTDRLKVRMLHSWIESSDVGLPLKDRRRYITTSDLARRWRTPFRIVQEIVDSWAGRGILRRGECLWCEDCRYTGWYDADDIGQQFRCQRCRSVHPVTAPTHRPRPERESSFHYSMNEVVVQALSHHITLPVWVLRWLRPDRGSILWVPERTVWKDERRIQEVDLWAIVDGRIVLGEVTSSDVLESTKTAENERIGRLARLVNDLAADTLVVATSRPAWSARTLKSLKQIEVRCGIAPTLLTDIGVD